MTKQTIVKALFLCVLTLTVAACTAAPRKGDRYMGNDGQTVMLDTDRESCVRSCNADYDRCSGTRAAESVVGRGQMTGLFGAEADCKNALKSCLPLCRERM